MEKRVLLGGEDVSEGGRSTSPSADDQDVLLCSACHECGCVGGGLGIINLEVEGGSCFILIRVTLRVLLKFLQLV